MKPAVLNLISYSGGKDSGALALHMIEQGIPNLVLVFCDTQWEHPITMRYVHEFARAVGLRLVVLASEGMVNLVHRKQRPPSPKARFCTEELKLNPFRDYVARLTAQGFKTAIFLGERADESPARACKPAVEISDFYGCPIARPLLPWKLADVKAIHQRAKVLWNPLYEQGMSRVGCMPCIMARKDEVKAIVQRFPEVIDKVSELEVSSGHTWWGPNYIPSALCSREVTTKKGKQVRVPTAQDVGRWALTKRGGRQLAIQYPKSGCESPIGFCE